MPGVGRSFRPSGAMVVALVALFFAVGGVGYAKKVVHLISGSQIKKGSIDLSRLSRAAQAALKGHAGAQGPQGAQGPKGDQGPPGPATGPAGGALSGNYPNPSLANGAVDTSNFVSGATAPNAAKLGGIAPSGFWQLAGNAGTHPGTDFLGTTDAQPLTLKVNGQQALLLQPDATSPNLIGGYSGNSVASGKHGATIAGGGQNFLNNSVTGNFGTISGGDGNTAGVFGTVPGGNGNIASGNNSTASGYFNTASGIYSTAFGDYNTAQAYAATASGENNSASGEASTALGVGNTAGGYSATALGNSNSAGGAYSFAGGTGATVRSTAQGGPDNNSFVWSDGSGGISSSGTNQFDVRAAGGVTFQTNASGLFTGCQIAAGGGAWSCSSDRNVKRGFAPVSLQQVLRKIAGLWISTWSYKADPSHTRHIGPVAQDFKSAFGVGNDPRSIGLLDEGGVALAGVKGLYQLAQEQQTLMQRQQAEIAALQAQLTALKRQR